MARVWARLTLKRFVILCTIAGLLYVSRLLVTRGNNTTGNERANLDERPRQDGHHFERQEKAIAWKENSDEIPRADGLHFERREKAIAWQENSDEIPRDDGHHFGGKRKAKAWWENSHVRPRQDGFHSEEREKAKAWKENVFERPKQDRHRMEEREKPAASVEQKRVDNSDEPHRLQRAAKMAMMIEKDPDVHSNTKKQANWHTGAEIINPHPYIFTINNPGKCGDVFLLIMVTSAPLNTVQRYAIRRTWGNETNADPGTVIKTVFTVGKPDNQRVQTRLERENMVYKDIIQEDFVDSYRNLTLKTVMCLKWASEFCPGAKFVMKADDDTFVNIYSLVRYLKHLPATNTRGLVTGYLYSGAKPVRNRASQRGKPNKWYLSKEEYSRETFPNYPCGFAYVMSGDVVRPLYEVSPTVKYLFLEDVFLGLCLEKLGIEPGRSVRPPPSLLLQRRLVQNRGF
ncbi:hypothetical protein Bbelb_251790 [Branchiostoma belcheri]|nr:hypothetical protein Bbelb_251790 [Branchiostoma belcheri]